jgi:hypothetical protein
MSAVVHPPMDAPIPPIGSPDLSDRKYEQYGRPTTPLVGRFSVSGGSQNPDAHTLALRSKPGQAAPAAAWAGFPPR